jgi:threonine/homoserine/homoserine lactone efflux protein
MKNFAIFLVILTTVFLLVFTAMSQLDFSLQIMNLMFFLGNALILWMVYEVLTDKYSTKKEFKDWYEDRPKSKNNLKENKN